MKRDILRRVEKMEEAEAELFEEEEARSRRGKDMHDDNEIGVGTSAMGRIRLLGDGESDTDSSESNESSGAGPKPLDAETIIEQAYLRDASVFDWNANTRRGKGRVELRNLTGWADEQVEGWSVMLERTVIALSETRLLISP
jgi:activating signal cointegrator complex subunit 2